VLVLLAVVLALLLSVGGVGGASVGSRDATNISKAKHNALSSLVPRLTRGYDFGGPRDSPTRRAREGRYLHQEKRAWLL